MSQLQRLLCSTWLRVRATHKKQFSGLTRKRAVSIYVWNLAQLHLDSEEGIPVDALLRRERGIHVETEVVQSPDEASVRVFRERYVQ